MVKLPEEYQWSSYGAFIGIYDEEIISSDLILSYFNEKRKRIQFNKHEILGDLKVSFCDDKEKPLDTVI